jgi:succinate dehydrogenase/fumarate reductase flavoprotein subunit
LVGDNCETGVPGLYAAGDAASRERSHGAQTGGGAFNASWAICSGRWAGSAAARFARTAGPIRARRLKPARGSGLSARPVDTGRVIAAVQRETLPLDISYFRSVPVLRDSLGRLESLWHAVQGGRAQGDPEPTPRERLRAREAAAMVTVARWMHTAALARTESRGMHQLAEHPDTDPGQCHRLTIEGLDNVTVTPTAVPGWSGCPEAKEAV